MRVCHDKINYCIYSSLLGDGMEENVNEKMLVIFTRISKEGVGP